MSYPSYTLTCRRTSEISIWSSSQRTQVISSEKLKLDQDKYITGFSLSPVMPSSKKALILAVLSVLPIQIYKCNLVKLLGEPDQRSHQGPSPDNFPCSVHCTTVQNMSDTNTWNNQTKLIIACTGILSLKKVQHLSGYECLDQNSIP